LLWLLVLGPAATQAAEELVATLTWTGPTGTEGEVLFQGTADGSALQGRVYAGNDQLVVTGTIATDGGVSGTLTTTDGLAVGTFGGTRNGTELEGTYAVTGGDGSSPVPLTDPDEGDPGSSSGTWSAPAHKMPSPPPAP
jgi:hypothetical protein